MGPPFSASAVLRAVGSSAKRASTEPSARSTVNGCVGWSSRPVEYATHYLCARVAVPVKRQACQWIGIGRTIAVQWLPMVTRKAGRGVYVRFPVGVIKRLDSQADAEAGETRSDVVRRYVLEGLRKKEAGK